MKRVIALSLTCFGIVMGAYYYAWLQVETAIKENWITLVDKINNEGTLRIGYDDLDIDGFPFPYLRVEIRNLWIQSYNGTKMQWKTTEGFLQLSDTQLKVLFDKEMQVNYQEQLSGQPLSINVVYTQEPLLEITTFLNPAVLLKKLLTEPDMHWMDFTLLKRIALVTEPADHRINIAGKKVIIEKNQGMQFLLEQTSFNQQLILHLFFHFSKYEKTSDYFEQLIANNQTQEKIKLLEWAKQLNQAIGPISIQYDASGYYQDIDSIATDLIQNGLDINSLSIQSNLGGIKFKLQGTPEKVTGSLELIQYQMLIQTLANYYNLFLDTEYGKNTAASIGLEMSPISTEEITQILNLLKENGKALNLTDLKFDYQFSSNHIDINGKGADLSHALGGLILAPPEEKSLEPEAAQPSQEALPPLPSQEALVPIAPPKNPAPPSILDIEDIESLDDLRKEEPVTVLPPEPVDHDKQIESLEEKKQKLLKSLDTKR